MSFSSIIAVAIVVVFSLHTPAVAAAEIVLVKDSAGPIVHLTGSIQSGDAEKLLDLITKEPWRTFRLSLDSPGGSVLEAIRLASVVQKVAMATEIRPKRVCASACFFVFLGGSPRYASGSELMLSPSRVEAIFTVAGRYPKGYVGVHRPFQPKVEAPQNSQTELMQAVIHFLDRQLIPRRITDAMMSRPSNDIYWLTIDDLKDIGEYAAHIEEFLIQRCDYNRNRNNRISTAVVSGRLEEAQRLEEVESRSRDCEVEETGNLRKAGLKEIKAGWRPSLPR